MSNSQREAVFGHYDYVPAPERDNPEAIRIGTWAADNIVPVPIPQLRKALGNRGPETNHVPSPCGEAAPGYVGGLGEGQVA